MAFHHLNTMACLTQTTLSIASCHKISSFKVLKHKICIKEVKINLEEPTGMNDQGRLKERGIFAHMIIY